MLFPVQSVGPFKSLYIYPPPSYLMADRPVTCSFKHKIGPTTELLLHEKTLRTNITYYNLKNCQLQSGHAQPACSTLLVDCNGTAFTQFLPPTPNIPTCVGPTRCLLQLYPTKTAFILLPLRHGLCQGIDHRTRRKKHW